MIVADAVRGTPAAAERTPQVDRLAGAIDFADSTLQPDAATDPARDLVWWQFEANRTGTDWPALVPHLVQRLLELEGLCMDLLDCIEALEDEHSPFAWIVEAEYQRRMAARQPERRPRPTPATVVEAILYSVQTRGPAALKEPANIERLSRCDAAALAEIDRRVAKLNGGEQQ